LKLSYYVYYRVRPECEADARVCIRDLLARIARSSSVEGRLLTKRDEPTLWMEVYAEVPQDIGFEALLDRTAREVGVETVLLPGSPRKVECFRD
jgi:hypothetical protein